MKKILIIMMLLISVTLHADQSTQYKLIAHPKLAAQGSDSKLEHKFITSYEQARQLSLKNKKPIFIFFTAKWCGPCQIMKSKTFQEKNVLVILDDYIPLLVDIDISEDIKTLSTYKEYSSIPSYSIITADPNPIRVKAFGGYMDSEKFIMEINSRVQMPAADDLTELQYEKELAEFYLSTRQLTKVIASLKTICENSQFELSEDYDELILSFLTVVMKSKDFQKLFEMTLELLSFPNYKKTSDKIKLYHNYSKSMIEGVKNAELDQYIEDSIKKFSIPFPSYTNNGDAASKYVKMINSTLKEMSQLADYSYLRLLKGLSSSNKDISEDCATSLGWAKLPQTVKPLSELLKDKNAAEYQRLNAIKAIKLTKNSEFVSSLIKVAKDKGESKKMRANCISALYELCEYTDAEQKKKVSDFATILVGNNNVDLRAHAITVLIKAKKTLNSELTLKLLQDDRRPKVSTKYMTREKDKYGNRTYKQLRVLDLAIINYLESQGKWLGDAETNQPVQSYKFTSEMINFIKSNIVL